MSGTIAARNSATMTVRNTPLLGPVLTRVIGMLAARAQCPIDRLDDALIVADAVAAHSPDFARDGKVVVELGTEEGLLEVVVAGLKREGGNQLLDAADLPGVGNLLRRVADSVEVRPDPDGAGEALYIRLGFGQ